MTPDVLGIGESCLYVDDLDAAEQWYNDVLDLDTAFRDASYCFLNTTSTGHARQHVILFEPDYTENQSSPPRHGTTDDIHLALDVKHSDLNDWRTHLKQHNITIEDEISWGKDHSIYFRDPYNNSLELYGRATY